MEKLNISLVQSDLVWENPTANKENFERLFKDLKLPTDLIILPEMFTTGFSMEPKNLAEPTNGSSFTWLQEQAKKLDSAITGSLIIKENDHYYNRLYFVLPDGSYHQYDKRHLFSLAKEEESYIAGAEKIIIEYKGWRICPLICYDLRFPVWARNVEAYDFLFYIASWPTSRILHWDTMLRSRAIENQTYVAGVNRIGEDPNNNTYNGHSAIYDPLGKTCIIEESEKEIILQFDLDKNHLQDVRRRFKFLNDRDEFMIL